MIVRRFTGCDWPKREKLWFILFYLQFQFSSYHFFGNLGIVAKVPPTNELGMVHRYKRVLSCWVDHFQRLTNKILHQLYFWHFQYFRCRWVLAAEYHRHMWQNMQTNLRISNNKWALLFRLLAMCTRIEFLDFYFFHELIPITKTNWMKISCLIQFCSNSMAGLFLAKLPERQFRMGVVQEFWFSPVHYHVHTIP